MSANAADKPVIDTVVMSGGAPQSPLMAGFLYELLCKGKTFQNFHTSGAGALMALLLIAPKNKNPKRTLRSWVDAGVADEIYAAMPVNFKLFQKPGPFAPLYKRMAERLKVPLDGRRPEDTDDPFRDLMAEWLATPRPNPVKWPKQLDPADRLQDRFEMFWQNDPNPNKLKDLRTRLDPIKRMRDTWLRSWLKDDAQKRLYNDIVDLWFSAITPSTLSPKSKGLAAPLPFLEELVCFETARDRGDKKGLIHFCVNAYNMTEEAKKKDDPIEKWKEKSRKDRNESVMWLFGSPIVKPAWQKDGLNGGHIRAAFSMPFIYPPARIGDHYFSEGADHQPINFHTLWNGGRTHALLLDVLGGLEDLLVRTPRDLWDAYVISIMTPVVALAREDVQDFKDAKASKIAGRAPHGVELVEAVWNIPPEFEPYVMDWSRSNLKRLFEVGQEACTEFLKKYDAPDYLAVFKEPVPAE